MQFLVPLFCIGLERFFSLEKFLKRECAFNYYFTKVAQFAPEEWQQGSYGLFVFLLPIEFLLFILYVIGIHYFSSLLLFLLEVVVLLYCLGPYSVYHFDKPIPQDFFYKVYISLFGTLFWFSLLGPLGVLLYRLLERIAMTPLNQDESIAIKSHIIYITQPLFGYLNWLPVRLFAGAQALISQVPNTANIWLDHLLSNWEYHEKLTAILGRVTLKLTPDAVIESKQYTEGLAFIDRLLLWSLGLILIKTLISWFL